MVLLILFFMFFLVSPYADASFFRFPRPFFLVTRFPSS